MPSPYDPEKAREYYRRRMQDPEFAARRQERGRRAHQAKTPEERQRLIEYKQKRREALWAQGLTASGTVPVSSRAGKTMDELRDAKREREELAARRKQEREQRRTDPAWIEQKRERAKINHRIRYELDLDYRLYHREKSKRRKAQERGSIGLKVKPKQIRARFEQFGHRCAYCGAEGDLQIEHLVPIAKGGTHTLGNILPACQRCNFSKRDNDAERWYRRQPYFSEAKWRKILQVLGLAKGSPAQLTLL